MRDDKNLKGENSIITIDEIQTILTDFKIGKKPLAKLLGWGETTIIRYIEGDVPTTEYSDKLKAILQNPYYYFEILRKNKNNLTGVAFKKSKKAVLEKLMESKIRVIAQYIINMCGGEATASNTQTLLYYMQGFSLALNGLALFEDDYYITYNNMPYLNIYEDMKLHGICELEISEDALTEKEKNLIVSVLNSFNWYGPKLLNAMTSYERTLLRISRDKDNNKLITKETIKAFFTELLEQYDINDISEIGKYPDKRMSDIKNISTISYYNSKKMSEM